MPKNASRIEASLVRVTESLTFQIRDDARKKRLFHSGAANPELAAMLYLSSLSKDEEDEDVFSSVVLEVLRFLR